MNSIEAFRLGIDPMPDWFADEVTAGRVELHNRDWRHYGGPDKAYMWELKEGRTISRYVAMRGDYIIRGDKGLYSMRPWQFEGRPAPTGLEPK